ncbi:unnamed protein product [Amoebophrya sp. A25]|nr:unnamed protein product [Amoebophrya sp. A25]|eukprot:GSA25T00020333001.1
MAAPRCSLFAYGRGRESLAALPIAAAGREVRLAEQAKLHRRRRLEKGRGLIEGSSSTGSQQAGLVPNKEVASSKSAFDFGKNTLATQKDFDYDRGIKQQAFRGGDSDRTMPIANESTLFGEDEDDERASLSPFLGGDVGTSSGDHHVALKKGSFDVDLVTPDGPSGATTTSNAKMFRNANGSEVRPTKYRLFLRLTRNFDTGESGLLKESHDCATASSSSGYVKKSPDPELESELDEVFGSSELDECDIMARRGEKAKVQDAKGDKKGRFVAPAMRRKELERKTRRVLAADDTLLALGGSKKAKGSKQERQEERSSLLAALEDHGENTDDIHREKEEIAEAAEGAEPASIKRPPAKAKAPYTPVLFEQRRRLRQWLYQHFSSIRVSDVHIPRRKPHVVVVSFATESQLNQVLTKGRLLRECATEFLPGEIVTLERYQDKRS